MTTAERYIAIVLVVGTVGYGLFEARALMQGPLLSLREPAIGELQTNVLYEVRGSVKNVTRVLVNGRPITIDTKGEFAEKLVTPQGLGVLLVEAENRFGKKTSQKIDLVGRPPDE